MDEEGGEDEESDAESGDPGMLDHKADSRTSLDSMDDDLRKGGKGRLPGKQPKSGSGGDTIRLHDRITMKYIKQRVYDTFSCCSIY